MRTIFAHGLVAKRLQCHWLGEHAANNFLCRSALKVALVYVRSNPFVAGLGESTMEQILINLVAGALGGVGAGKSSPTFDLGTVGNIISGLVGGGVLGQIVTLLLPSVVAAAESGNLSVGGIVSQVVAGGAGGAVLTAIIGAIKNRATA
jgi:hypothetical protein